jgi:outer membrane assembly lipoprotein YfiO
MVYRVMGGLSLASVRSCFGVRLRLLALALVLPVGACSIFDKDTVQIPDQPADQIYNEALFLLNQKSDYKAAAKRFEEVDRQHPYSEWSRKALLMSAYAYYEAREYDDAVSAARRYVTLHPASPDAAYAQFIIGSSHYDQIPDVTRDQKRTEEAIKALEEVIRKYPNTEYAISAKRKLDVGRDQIAGDQPLQDRGDAVPDHAARGRSADAAGRMLYGARHRAGGADRGRRSRPQFPGQPLVSRRLSPGEVRWTGAARGPGFLDQPRLQENRPRLGALLRQTVE